MKLPSLEPESSVSAIPPYLHVLKHYNTTSLKMTSKSSTDLFTLPHFN